MEPESELKRHHSLKSSLEKQRSSALARTEVLINKLARFYSVMGNAPDEPGALSLMAEIIGQSGTDEQIAEALTRCTRECKYPVRLPDILQRIPGNEVPHREAQARAAWDLVVKFVRREVYTNPTDGDGVCINQCLSPSCTIRGTHYKDAHLPQQLRDVVRRVGGWPAVSLAVTQNDPFVKKEFLAEWQAYQAVENVQHSLTGIINVELKQLAERKSM